MFSKECIPLKEEFVVNKASKLFIESFKYILLSSDSSYLEGIYIEIILFFKKCFISDKSESL